MYKSHVLLIRVHQPPLPVMTSHSHLFNTGRWLLAPFRVGPRLRDTYGDPNNMFSPHISGKLHTSILDLPVALQEAVGYVHSA